MDSTSARPKTSRIGGLEQLGHYELVCVLARSDLGSLWASVVTHGESAGHLVAVQRIVVRPDDEADVVPPLRDAIEPLKGVHLPGVIPVLDFVANPGRLGIVSEYVEGEPLRSLQNLATLKRFPITPNVALRLALDMLASLASFHDFAVQEPSRAKFVYGGLSPDTVLVSSSGRVLLLNPGLGAAAASVPALCGTASAQAYRAPEQFDANTPVGARADVFVAGVILWELLAQKPLFQLAKEPAATDGNRGARRGEPGAMAECVLFSPIPRLDTPSIGPVKPVSKGIADVVARALERDVALRFATPGEMADALAEAAKGCTAEISQVAAMIDALAASTLQTRQSAIARAGVGKPADKKPADVAVRLPDATRERAEAVLDDMIRSLGEGALAMTPTPSAAIAPMEPKPEQPVAIGRFREPAVSPRAEVAPKPEQPVAIAPPASEPRPALIGKTPAGGVVRPLPAKAIRAKAEVMATQQALEAGANAAPSADTGEEIVPEDEKAVQGPSSKRTPPPSSKRSVPPPPSSPDQPLFSAVAEAGAAGALPAAETAAPLSNEVNAFLDSASGDAFSEAGAAKDEPEKDLARDAEPNAPAAEEAEEGARDAAAGNTTAGNDASLFTPAKPKKESIKANEPMKRPGVEAVAEAEERQPATKRRRTGFIALGVVVALAAAVGIVATISGGDGETAKGAAEITTAASAPGTAASAPGTAATGTAAVVTSTATAAASTKTAPRTAGERRSPPTPKPPKESKPYTPSGI